MPQTDDHIFELDDDVTGKPVSYENRFGITLSADLSLPKDFDEADEHAAIASELVGAAS